MKRWKKALLIAGIVIASLALIAAGLIFWQLSRIGRAEPVDTIPPGEEYFPTDEPGTLSPLPTVDPGEVEWPPAEMPFGEEGIINILLLGQDRREGQSRQRSDAMIILSYDASSGLVKLISLMRDLYVQIPGYSDNRLNTAYLFGGFDLLSQTVETNFGIEVDGSVEVDFEGFTEIIDIMGGIDITLTAEEAEYLNLDEGVNHLDGKQTLTYSRLRNIGNSDFTRTERQRIVITQVINSVKDLNVASKMKMLYRVLPCLTTDLSNAEILDYVYTVLRNGINGIESYRIPGDGTFEGASINGMSVIIPDLEANRELLKEWIYGTED